MSADIQRLRREFQSAFVRPPQHIAEAPGRVNLIGEHTDYNQGFVLPAAIDRTVAVAAAARNDARIAVHSLDYRECDEFSLDGIAPAGGWRDYVRGVAWALAETGHNLVGTDLAISGDIPQGAGLSSSAAFEVAVAGALTAVSRLSIPGREVALIAQRAENGFVGVRCGIMDQFAASLSRAGHALFIDCRTLEIDHVPLPLDEAGVALVLVDSGVPRRLGDAPYNQRREECAEAARQLGVPSLRDASISSIESLPEPYRRRARHVVQENDRVLGAVAALRAEDLQRFGRLMYDSHTSLRDDFEVSCQELDLLVELASRTDGVLGARLTGAGFGGCTVNLVRREALDEFAGLVIEPYRTQTGLPAQMYVCRSANGMKVSHV